MVATESCYILVGWCLQEWKPRRAAENQVFGYKTEEIVEITKSCGVKNFNWTSWFEIEIQLKRRIKTFSFYILMINNIELLNKRKTIE